MCLKMNGRRFFFLYRTAKKSLHGRKRGRMALIKAGTDVKFIDQTWSAESPQLQNRIQTWAVELGFLNVDDWNLVEVCSLFYYGYSVEIHFIIILPESISEQQTNQELAEETLLGI